MTEIFDIHIVNLHAGSKICMMSEKALAESDKEKNNKYLHPCLEIQHQFTSIFLSAYGIP